MKRLSLTIAAAVLAFFALTASSVADPGSPALADASQAVYPNSGQQGASDVPSTLAYDPGGSSEPSSGALPVSNTAPEVSGGGTSLPMTGLAAFPLLLTGLIALALGMSIRLALPGPDGRSGAHRDL